MSHSYPFVLERGIKIPKPAKSKPQYLEPVFEAHSQLRASTNRGKERRSSRTIYSRLTYPMREMEVGESFALRPRDKAHAIAIRTAFSNWASKRRDEGLPHRFTIVALKGPPKDFLRIWRIA